MATNTAQQDQESLQASRQRIQAEQQAARAGNAAATSIDSIKDKIFGTLFALIDLDGLEIALLGIAAFKDAIDMLLGMITADIISLIDWVIDIPLVIFFMLIAVALILSHPSSLKTIILGLFGPVGVGLVEISPAGILPAYIGFALWLIVQVNKSKAKAKQKKQKQQKQINQMQQAYDQSS